MLEDELTSAVGSGDGQMRCLRRRWCIGAWNRLGNKYQVIAIVRAVAVDGDRYGCAMSLPKVLERFLGLRNVDGDRWCGVLIGVQDGEKTGIPIVLSQLDDWCGSLCAV